MEGYTLFPGQDENDGRFFKGVLKDGTPMKRYVQLMKFLGYSEKEDIISFVNENKDIVAIPINNFAEFEYFSEENKSEFNFFQIIQDIIGNAISRYLYDKPHAITNKAWPYKVSEIGKININNIKKWNDKWSFDGTSEILKSDISSKVSVRQRIDFCGNVQVKWMRGFSLLNGLANELTPAIENIVFTNIKDK